MLTECQDNEEHSKAAAARVESLCRIIVYDFNISAAKND